MPYKDSNIRKTYHANYNKNLTPEQIARKRETDKAWWASDKGQYLSHKRRAQRSGIEFILTFDEWLQIWTESGHYSDRSPVGFVMCRNKDEGPYSKENVYIASASQNKRDAWFNNKITTPTGVYYKDTL